MWSFKVVKKQRDGDGKFFAYPAAATFERKADALKYARDFANAQRAAGVAGTIIAVCSRKKVMSDCGIKTHTLTEFRV
jgi:hypothetical protein